jgi:putative membrane-bound dehydrogenase-like protein
MTRTRALLGILLLLAATVPAGAGEPQLDLRVPAGFEVTEFAGSRLANDIYRLTIDPKGRLVAAGRGYLRILVDEDGDGTAERAIPFADAPKDGAMGLLWEGDTLYVTGDGGLRRFRDADGDGRADGPSELIRAMKTGGEHDAHDIRRGPDGWLYVLCGNMAGIDRRFAQLATSPIQDPVAGCVIRFTPDLRVSEIVADGFRNAYGMDFNPDGELFTCDSDNERCVSLPWYEPTRVYHVIPGGHYGWRSPQRAQWWRFPPYFPDVVAPVTTLGRGSPTGVACYRHGQFPARYRGGLFVLDWTFGKVWFLKLDRAGATFTCAKEVFIEAVGDNGFAPTDVVVHPTTGDLYISVGGRGTRGAVYRVRYPPGLNTLDPAAVAALQPRPRTLAWRPDHKDELLAQAVAVDGLKRLQALIAIRRHRERFSADELAGVIRANWDHADRPVRKATADLLAALDEAQRQEFSAQARTPIQETTCCLGVYADDPADVLARAGRLLRRKDLPAEVRLARVRLIQLALGDLVAPAACGTVWEGYTPRALRADAQALGPVRAALREAFPTGHADLDREISRTLAVLEDDDPDTLAKVAARFSADSDPVDDLHFLIVLARLRADRPAEVTDRVATALLDLDRKTTQRRLNRDRHWPLRLAELHAELARKDPKLNAAILAHRAFGRPDHAVLTRAPGFDRRRAAAVFLARAEQAPDFLWTLDLVALLDSLPAEQARPVLRRLWEQAGLREAILPLLARDPQPADRGRFLEGLSSPQLATIRLCLDALEKLPPAHDGPSLFPLIRALRALPDGKEENQLRERIGRYLQRVTGQDRLGADKQAWTDWFAKTYPELAERLGGPDGVDLPAWTRRLARLDWAQGDARRGLAVFHKAGCASCHSGAQALGPDLRGSAQRFARDDLFLAIIQPSRDVPPRYQTTLIATADGQVYQGSIIYEAVDSVILQTGPATTVRLTNPQIVSRRVTPNSLMPAGLLDPLTDQEIVDLYAYLRSLSASGPRRRRPRRTRAAENVRDALPGGPLPAESARTWKGGFHGDAPIRRGTRPHDPGLARESAHILVRRLLRPRPSRVPRPARHQ